MEVVLEKEQKVFLSLGMGNGNWWVVIILHQISMGIGEI
jgi:hypothetical protein